MIWMYNSYIDGNDMLADRIVAYSATATTSKWAAHLDLREVDGGVPQTLAIASGTLLQETISDGLLGYRIPNT